MGQSSVKAECCLTAKPSLLKHNDQALAERTLFWEALCDLKANCRVIKLIPKALPGRSKSMDMKLLQNQGVVEEREEKMMLMIVIKQNIEADCC